MFPVLWEIMAGAAGVSKPTCIFQILLAQAKKEKYRQTRFGTADFLESSTELLKNPYFDQKKKKKKVKTACMEKKIIICQIF